MRNPTFEQALEKQGVTFAYVEEVALMEIDAAKGLRNQARLEEPLDAELTETYACSYRDGYEFPPLVLHRPGPRSKFVPVDGNHRLGAAHKAGKKTHDAYVLETTDQQVLDRITWTFNNSVNGKRLTREECLEHAISFVQKYGYTAVAAAKEWGVPPWQVQRGIRVNGVRNVLSSGGVRPCAALSDEVLNTLAPLEDVGEDVLVEAGKVVGQTGISIKECEELVKDVKRAKTHEAKVKVVQDFAQSPVAKQRQAETKGGRVRPPSTMPRTQLVRLIAQANKLFEDYQAKEALRPPNAEFKRVREEAGDLVHRLITLFGLGALPKEETA
jgi:hypothetical protein